MHLLRPCLALLMMFAAVVPAGGHTPAQEVHGRLLAGAPNGYELARRAYAASDGAVNGVAGFVFALNPNVIGGHFSLELVAPLPAPAASTLSVVFATDIAGTVQYCFPGTDMIVPCGRYGIVWMANGVDTPFVFRAYEPAPDPEPTETPEPTPTPTDTPTPDPTPTPTPTPDPEPELCSPEDIATPDVLKPLPEGGPSTTEQGNVRHDGYQPDTNLAPPLVCAWASGAQSTNWPVAADGRLFYVESDGDRRTTLYAVDLGTGEPLWQSATTGDYGESFLAYDDNTVFKMDFDGILAAYDAALGTLRWSIDLPNQSWFSSTPAVADGVLYVGGAGSGGTLYAVDQQNGDVLWMRGVANGDSSSPAIADGRVFVAYACQQTYAFLLDGAQAWHHSTGCAGGGGRTPVVHWNGVYDSNLGYGTAQVVLDMETGAETGTFTASTLPAFHDGLGFFLHNGTLRARNLEEQTTRWAFAGNGGLITAPTVWNGYVAVGATNGDLFVLSEDTGEVVWSGNLDATTGSVGVLVSAGGYLTVVGEEGIAILH